MMTFGYILGLYKSLFYANQKSFVVELSMLIYQGLNLLLIVLVLNHFKSSLIYVALIYGLSTILIGVFFSVKFFKKQKQIAPSLKFFKKRTVYDLFGLSINFFIIQLCMIIIFSTDNIIISKLLGPSEVTSYDIVRKLFQVIITFTIIIQDPFWALYSDAFEKKDFNWIKKTIKTWNILFIPFLLFVLMLIYFARPIIKFWIQYDLKIQQSLILFMGIFVIVRVYGIIYMYFLNGIGKIKLQLWLYVFGAVINIPLSIYFVKYMNLGSSGVILGTIFSMLGLMIFLPIQSFKILNQKDKINV
jgi:O-antigen/teichoic acid export membrane protein